MRSTAIPAPPLPTVQLRHELPDGSWHVDWMLARDPAGREPLVAFRLAERVDRLPAGAGGVPARRLADHRPVYLTYEGPLAAAPGSGEPALDRGRVRRVGSGRITAWGREPAGWTLTIDWCAAGAESGGAATPLTQRLELRSCGDDRWIVRALS